MDASVLTPWIFIALCAVMLGFVFRAAQWVREADNQAGHTDRYISGRRRRYVWRHEACGVEMSAPDMSTLSAARADHIICCQYQYAKEAMSR